MRKLIGSLLVSLVTAGASAGPLRLVNRADVPITVSTPSGYVHVPAFGVCEVLVQDGDLRVYRGSDDFAIVEPAASWPKDGVEVVVYGGAFVPVVGRWITPGSSYLYGLGLGVVCFLTAGGYRLYRGLVRPGGEL